MKKDRALGYIAGFCRLLVGAVFVFSGFVKAIDPMGFQYKIAEYLSAFGMNSLESAANAIAFSLIIFEFSLGICVLLGVHRRLSSAAAVLLMAVMTPLTLYLTLFNPVTDCGCFGDAIRMSNTATFIKNLIILPASVFLFIRHKKIRSFYPEETHWFIPVFALLYCLFFSLRNYNHLPVLDFRPYKIGVNIPSSMQIPEGAAVDEYEYSFIYEREGVKKTFSIDNYPAGDTAWKFVDTTVKLVKKGYAPPISSFNVWTLDGKRVDGEILNYDNLFILVSPKLEEASDEQINEITNLHEYAFGHNIPFYCITSSSKERIDEWIELTGAEYPFLTADETMLKTVVRSNPGFVWLNSGTIVMKRHYNELPNEGEISRLMEQKTVKVKGNAWIIFNLLTFTLPLLAVWTYGMIRFTWNNKKKGKKRLCSN